MSGWGYDGNIGVPRPRSTSNVDTFEIGDSGEEVDCSVEGESYVPFREPVTVLRLWKLPDLDLAINVFEGAGVLDPNMSLTENEWRDRCFFLDM